MSRKKILGERYQLGESLGHGAFSTVYTCVDRHTGRKHAVKVLNKARVKEAGMEEAFDREAAALRVLQAHGSRNVTNVLDILQSTRNFYLVTELADRGTLLQMVVKTNGGRGLPPHTVRKYLGQLLSGMADLHHYDIAHRDMKLENLLLDEWRELKISDFGFAACAPKGRMLFRQCGTPQYVAPEVLAGHGYYGAPADVWSVGVCFYVMLCGQLPFVAPDNERLFERIATGRYRVPKRSEGLSPVPPAALHFLSCCLHLTPEKRWTVDQLRRHPYVLGKDEVNVQPPRLPHPSQAHTSQAPLRGDESFPLSSGGLPSNGSFILAHSPADPDALLLEEEPGAEALVRSCTSCPNLSDLGRYRIDPALRRRSPLLAPPLGFPAPREGTDSRQSPVCLGLPGRLASASITDLCARDDSEILLGNASTTSSRGHHSRVPSAMSGSLSPRGGGATPQRRSGTPSDQTRFDQPLRHRFQCVHLLLLVQFFFFCTIVLVVGALRILFDVKLARLPLPRGVRRRLEAFFEPGPHPPSGSASSSSSTTSLCSRDGPPEGLRRRNGEKKVG